MRVMQGPLESGGSKSVSVTEEEKSENKKSNMLYATLCLRKCLVSFFKSLAHVIFFFFFCPPIIQNVTLMVTGEPVSSHMYSDLDRVIP